MQQKQNELATAFMQIVKDARVGHIFGVPSGNILPLCNAISDVGMKYIINKNEAGSAYAAIRYANASGGLGACLLGGCVGINNAINGVAAAQVGKVPLLIVSGDVPSHKKGKGAVQDVGTNAMLGSVVKSTKYLSDPTTALDELRDSISLATTHPCGPVHISIPIDVQMSLLENDPACFREKQRSATFELCSPKSISHAVSLIDQHKRGLILVGRGAKSCSAQIKALSQKLKWPIVSTVQGKGIIEDGFSSFAGNYGFLGTDLAKSFVEDSAATCLLVLGSSLGELTAKSQNDPLLYGREVIHIDSDKSELNKLYAVSCPVHGDLRNVLPIILNYCKEKASCAEVFPTKKNHPYVRDHSGLSLRKFVENLPDLVDREMYFISDIGEYMNFVFKYFPIKNNVKFEIDAAYGAMGFGVAGALGAHLADTKNQTVVMCGDGCFYMNGMELLTAKEYNAPIVYIVVNNSGLGYITKLQAALYERDLDGASFKEASISRLCKAMGIESLVITRDEDVPKISQFVKNIEGPRVVELITDGSERSGVEERAAALRGSAAVSRARPQL